jgi:hypothetical protein
MESRDLRRSSAQSLQWNQGAKAGGTLILSRVDGLEPFRFERTASSLPKESQTAGRWAITDLPGFKNLAGLSGTR